MPVARRAASTPGRQLFGTSPWPLASLHADDKEKPEQLISAVKELRSLKEQAQKCAVDAAPYLHPHLSAVSANANIKGAETCSLKKA
jgi:hypothetical protein